MIERRDRFDIGCRIGTRRNDQRLRPGPRQLRPIEGQDMLGTCGAIGEIDFATASVLSGDLHDAIDNSDTEQVVLDCSGLTFIDSSGFHALVEATAYAVGNDHTLVIRHMAPSCARVIQLCDWDNELRLELAA